MVETTTSYNGRLQQVIMVETTTSCNGRDYNKLKW